MPKFIVTWDAGFGPEYDVVECADLDKAISIAEECLKLAVDATYSSDAMPYTQENCAEADLDFEGEESP